MALSGSTLHSLAIEFMAMIYVQPLYRYLYLLIHVISIVHPSRGWSPWHPVSSSVDEFGYDLLVLFWPQNVFDRFGTQSLYCLVLKTQCTSCFSFMLFILGFLDPDVLVLSCASPDFTAPGGPYCSKFLFFLSGLMLKFFSEAFRVSL